MVDSTGQFTNSIPPYLIVVDTTTYYIKNQTDS